MCTSEYAAQNAWGGFACERIHELTAATAPELLGGADLDGDPGDELVIGNRDGPTVRVFGAL